ncbi:MAG: PQQ-binding-like beta-propeller repeat protein, partial [Pirellula sp.]
MIEKASFLREPRIWALGSFFVFSSLAVVAQEPHRLQDGFQVAPSDWPWWRGPHRNGTASSDQAPPVQWDATNNVVWKTPIPGRGYGSMCLVGDRVYLATSDESTGSQSVVCLDRANGKVLWMRVVHEQGGMRKNEKSTAASCTPACDGQHIYVAFPNDGRLMASALSLEGQVVWQTKITDYIEHQ